MFTRLCIYKPRYYTYVWVYGYNVVCINMPLCMNYTCSVCEVIWLEKYIYQCTAALYSLQCCGFGTSSDRSERGVKVRPRTDWKETVSRTTGRVVSGGGYGRY